jgi:glycosyltransferase involved in cell wall biosynthesis
LKKSITKILIAHSSNDLYGASKILLNIIELLINEGHEVYLFLPQKGPLQKNNIIKKCNINIVELGVFRKRYFNFFGLINRFYYIIKSTFVIRSFISKNKIDLVYTNTSTLISPTIASTLSGIPSIFHVHEIPDSSKLYTKFLAIFFNIFSNKVISVSNSVRNYWIDNGLMKEKIKTIYNGFNFNFQTKEKLSEPELVFCNISRIIPYKGHLFLIDLFYELLKYKDNLILNIIGDTIPAYEPYYRKLKEKISEYNLEKNIRFLGFKPNVSEILKKSNFLIHCPISPDPLPTVIFEGIESSTPVIFTNLGGSYEILDSGKNGLAIDHLSVKSSVEIILEFIDNTVEQEKNIKNAKSFVEKNFQMSSFNNSLKTLISKIVKKT